MSKRSAFGKITKPLRDKPRKMPGRHKKNRNNTKKEWENIGEKAKKDVDKYPLISYI